MATDQLSAQGQKTVEELAQKYDVSIQAVNTLLQAVEAGHGTMAQFNIHELGGMGQWSQGGMTMVGDMFNNALKNKVDGLCSELAKIAGREPIRAQGESTGAWWGNSAESPAATGSQNDTRYAYFRKARRLAIQVGDKVTMYDTQDHDISGASQQQSGDSSMAFVSQRGVVRVADLPEFPANSTDAQGDWYPKCLP